MRNNASGISIAAPTGKCHDADESTIPDFPNRKCFLLLFVGVVASGILLVPGTAKAKVDADWPAIQYVVEMNNPAAHKLSVMMTIPDAGGNTEIQFPAWNALYQIRDFVKNVEGLSARCDGTPETLIPVDVNSWRSSSSPCESLEVKYRVYANEEGIFSSILNPSHCYLNLAMILFYLPRQRGRATQIKFLMPQSWKLFTLLIDGPQPNEFTAGDYDDLVDCPVEAGPAPQNDSDGMLHEFIYNQNGVEYRLVIFGNPSDYSPGKLLGGLKKITATETRLMGGAPFSRYTFILHFPHGPGGGGMEHRNGAAISLSATGLRDSLTGFESVAAHEFFHAWNVKRIRPQDLEPIDYIHGNDTSDLWFSEGVSSTYGELALLRSGLISRQDFYHRLAEEIRSLQSRPGRLAQSVAESGRDAWLEKYADYRRPERSISYYNKGELVGFLLDLAIRQASNGTHSLDDAMRRLNSDFARRGRFFTQSDLRAIIFDLAPGFSGLDRFFHDYVEGTTELDYDKYLGFAGLQVVTSDVKESVPGFRMRRNADGEMEVQFVEEGSKAEAAGLGQGDIIAQLNGRPAAEISRREMSELNPEEPIRLQVRRANRTLDIQFVPVLQQETEYQILELPGASKDQLKIRKGWLEGTTSLREEN